MEAIQKTNLKKIEEKRKEILTIDKDIVAFKIALENIPTSTANKYLKYKQKYLKLRKELGL